MGDVHRADITIADAVRSEDFRIVMAAKAAESAGRKTLRIAVIAGMDGAGHYLWATPVIIGPGHGITQQDVARLLYDVVSCP